MIFTTNIKHPKEFSRSSGKVALVDEVEAINQSIRLILTTAKGELYGDPNFGCNLYSFIYDHQGPALSQLIAEDIADCVNAQESRVFINADDIKVTEEGRDLRILVPYNIRYTEYRSDYAFLIERRSEEVI